MGTEKCSKVTTIQECQRAEKARIRDQARKDFGITDDYEFWEEKDMEVLGLNKFGLEIDEITGKIKPQCTF